MVALPLSPEMPSAAPQTRARRPARLAAFLILLVFAMVLVGGATRLTESGPLDHRVESRRRARCRR